MAHGVFSLEEDHALPNFRYVKITPVDEFCTKTDATQS